MNVLHMKYVVEVAKAGSISKAAEELFVAQPNLSRCIKELEGDLGITIFARTARGMQLTSEGEDFIYYAKKALGQIDDIERMYKKRMPPKQSFFITVPRASYISSAFVEFSKALNSSPTELYYMEANSSTAIHNILKKNYHLAIIRYAAKYDDYFSNALREKGLVQEYITDFRYVLIMSRNCAIADKPEIHFSDLEDLMEIVHGDPYVPSLPVEVLKREETPDSIRRRIYLFERGGQFDILADNPETFMWVSPIPGKLLMRYGLVQRRCADNQKIYRDVLIRRKEHNLTQLDEQFIAEVKTAEQKCLGDQNIV